MTFIRRLIKFCLAVLLYYSGYLSLVSLIRRRNESRTELAVLMYHCVLKDNDWQKRYIQPSLRVTLETFEKQMAFLANNYNVISLETLACYLDRQKPLPPKCVVITFDDGWRDNYINAFPVLKKYNLPATIFLISDIIESNKLPPAIEIGLLLNEPNIWPQKANDIFSKVYSKSGLSQPDSGSQEQIARTFENTHDFMMKTLELGPQYVKIISDEFKKSCGIDSDDWDNRNWMLKPNEVKEMSENGIEFGSHGRSHELMTGLDKERINLELTESKKLIEELVGKPVLFFAYPVGYCNAEIRRSVQAAGYTGAAAVSGCDKDIEQPDIFGLKRHCIHDGTSLSPFNNLSKAIFACHLEGIF